VPSNVHHLNIVRRAVKRPKIATTPKNSTRGKNAELIKTSNENNNEPTISQNSLNSPVALQYSGMFVMAIV
jgi:hypothetical protein